MTTQSIGWQATAGSANSQELISDFKLALRQEIEEIKKGRDGQTLTIRKGKILFSSANQFVYRFLIDSNINIPDDTPIEISIKSQEINGQIVSTDIEGINIAFEENMGYIIPELTIKTSRSKLSEILLSKFEDIKSEEMNSDEILLNIEGGMKLFAFKESGMLSDTCDTPLDFTGYNYVPNDDQVNAVLKSLTQEITFIWGPPGTGKTRILSIILDQLTRSNKKVLLVSHTNLAVDEILSKYANNQDYNEIIEDGRIIRYGIPTKQNSQFEKFIADDIVRKKASKKYDKIRSLEITIENLEMDENSLDADLD